MITLFTMAGSAEDPRSSYSQLIGTGVDQGVYAWDPVDYPGAIWPFTDRTDSDETYLASVQTGSVKLKASIDACSGPFALFGHSQGAHIISITAQLLSPDQRSRLVAVATTGNPARQAGHTFPGGLAAVGRGISWFSFTDYPTPRWNDYTLPYDFFPCAPDDTFAHDIYVMVAGHQRGPADPHKLAARMGKALVSNYAPTHPGFGKTATLLWDFMLHQPHFHYSDREILPGITPVAHAIGFFNEAAHDQQ